MHELLDEILSEEVAALLFATSSEQYEAAIRAATPEERARAEEIRADVKRLQDERAEANEQAEREARERTRWVVGWWGEEPRADSVVAPGLDPDEALRVTRSMAAQVERHRLARVRAASRMFRPCGRPRQSRPRAVRAHRTPLTRAGPERPRPDEPPPAASCPWRTGGARVRP